MKIIEQAGFAHRRSRRTCDDSDRNSAAWVAMNASRGFPPNSRCQCVSLYSPSAVNANCVLAGADCMKKLSSYTDALRDRAVVDQRLDHVPQGRAQPAQGPGLGQVSGRHARSLDPPPGLRAALGRQEIVPRRRSGRRDGIDQIHGDNGLADHREAPATGTSRGIGIIDIRDFDECHEFFETFDPATGISNVSGSFCPLEITA